MGASASGVFFFSVSVSLPIAAAAAFDLLLRGFSWFWS